jgi:hypothetical protein
VPNDALEANLKTISVELRMQALNSLLSQNRLKIFTNAAGKMHYKEVKVEEAVKCAFGLTLPVRGRVFDCWHQPPGTRA